MRKINKIVIHCSATPENRHVTVQDIDRWHKDRGWAGIGYHWVIYLDGTIHRGRAEEKVGAHVSGHNLYSIGVCYIGGVDIKNNPKDTRTEAQRLALRQLVEELKARYPRATVHGHNEFAAKACPCFNVKNEL